MLKSNEQISISGIEMIEVLKELELILISLHKIGSYYGERFIEDEDKYRTEYEKQTTRFIDEWKVTQRLAKVRQILSLKFDDTLGEDDMDDVERAMKGLKFWESPNDTAPEDSF